jgi:acyl-coenzyme A thioesterase PaaI-like protein
MDVNTHERIDRTLCGTPLDLSEGRSRVRLETLACMAVDDRGLVHGGFVFGLADYAAMLAVNDPNVVLGAAEVRFVKPVRLGQTMTAEAAVEEEKGRKRQVAVRVLAGEEPVFEGRFTCFVLDRHVLD